MSPDDRSPASRGSVGLLRDRNFGAFFVGKLLAAIGVWIHNTAAAIVVWDLTRSTLLVGAVSVAQFTPQLLLSPWGGARADRADRRRQLSLSWIVTSVGSGALALWIATFGIRGTSGAVIVIVAAGCVGVGFALGVPAMNALMPTLVRPRELPVAIALGALPMTVARAAGPALGALLLHAAGPAAAFATAAGMNVVFVVVSITLKVRATTAHRAHDGSVSAGWRYLRSEARMFALMLGVVAIGVGADPVITLTPALSERLGEASTFVGTLASAFGVGAAGGFLLLGRIRGVLGLERLGVTGLAILAGGMFATALAPSAGFAVAAIGIAGAGMAWSLTALTTMIQQQVPDELRGRIMALWGVAFLGSRPLAAGFSGWIADVGSVTIAMLAVVVVVVIGALLVRPSRLAVPD